MENFVSNNINISIVQNVVENSLDSTRHFGISLTKALSIIKMVHWYTVDYNAHKIIGNLYEELDGLFDRLQEEIIGTSQQQNKNFPHIQVDLDLENIQNYVPVNGQNMETYYKVNQLICSTLNSPEFNAYVQSTISGINNIKEEILSAFNKANYLLNMVKS